MCVYITPLHNIEEYSPCIPPWKYSSLTVPWDDRAHLLLVGFIFTLCIHNLKGGVQITNSYIGKLCSQRSKCELHLWNYFPNLYTLSFTHNISPNLVFKSTYTVRGFWTPLHGVQSPSPLHGMSCNACNLGDFAWDFLGCTRQMYVT